MTQHLPSFALGSVSGPGEHPDLGKTFPRFFENLPELAQRLQQIALDIIIQGLQRGDVKDAQMPGRQGARDQSVESPQEGG